MTALAIAVNFFSFRTITLKFLTKGHTFMKVHIVTIFSFKSHVTVIFKCLFFQADQCHGRIEKNRKYHRYLYDFED